MVAARQGGVGLDHHLGRGRDDLARLELVCETGEGPTRLELFHGESGVLDSVS